MGLKSKNMKKRRREKKKISVKPSFRKDSGCCNVTEIKFEIPMRELTVYSVPSAGPK